MADNAFRLDKHFILLMLLLLTILLFIKSINNCNCQSEELVRRIYHGIPDTDNRYPYVVSIEMEIDHNYVRICSGIVIDENWILTAGHCIRENMTLSVTYRNRTNKTSFERVNILANIRHLNYQNVKSPSDNLPNFDDIALIKVEKIVIDSFATLSSDNNKTFAGLSVVFAGYGNTWNKSEAATYADWKDKKLLLNYIPLLVGMGVVITCGIDVTEELCLCVRGTDTFTRQGDSGGPLVHDGTVIGVHIGKLNDAMAFISISRHLNWIRKEISKHQPISQNYSSMRVKFENILR